MLKNNNTKESEFGTKIALLFHSNICIIQVVQFLMKLEPKFPSIFLRNLQKILRTLMLKNICERLLLAFERLSKH